MSELHYITEMIRVHDEAIAITKFSDDEQVYMSWWEVGHGTRPRWRLRLQHIWNIIKYGHPFTDDMVLYPEDVDKLIETLQRTREVKV